MKGLTGCGKGVREESKGSEVGGSALWMEGVDGLTMTARRVVEAPRNRGCSQESANCLLRLLGFQTPLLREWVSSGARCSQVSPRKAVMAVL